MKKLCYILSFYLMGRSYLIFLWIYQLGELALFSKKVFSEGVGNGSLLGVPTYLHIWSTVIRDN